MISSHDIASSRYWPQKVKIDREDEDEARVVPRGPLRPAAVGPAGMLRHHHLDWQSDAADVVSNNDVETSSMQEQVQTIDHVLEEIRRHSILSSSQQGLVGGDQNDFDETSSWQSNESHNRRLQRELKEVDDAYLRSVGGRFRRLRTLVSNRLWNPLDAPGVPRNGDGTKSRKLADASIEDVGATGVGPSEGNAKQESTNGFSTAASQTQLCRTEVPDASRPKWHRSLRAIYVTCLLISLLVAGVTAATVAGNRNNQSSTISASSSSNSGGGQGESNAFLDEDPMPSTGPMNNDASANTTQGSTSPSLDEDEEENQLGSTTTDTTTAATLSPATLEPTQEQQTTEGPTKGPAGYPVPATEETISSSPVSPAMSPSSLLSPIPPANMGLSSLSPSVGKDQYIGDDYEDETVDEMYAGKKGKGKGGHLTERDVSRRRKRQRRLVHAYRTTAEGDTGRTK